MKVTAILSVIMMAALFLLLFSAVALIQNRKFFSTAPKDIQEKITDHSERFPGQKIFGYKLAVIALFMIVYAFIYGGKDGLRNNFTFMQFFGRYLTMLCAMKAFDIVFFDWYLLTKSHFFQYYYPETEGSEGYHSFGYNRKEQLTEICLYPLFSLLGAWITTLFR